MVRPIVICSTLICYSTVFGRDIPEAPVIGNWPEQHAAAVPVPMTQVQVDGFLGRHIDANNDTSLPAGLQSPIPAGFEARSSGQEPPEACRRLAADSDFYKWLEGAAYALAYEPDLYGLRTDLGRYTDMLVRLQEPGGYLGTRVNPAAPFDDKVNHDLYCAGHFIEAAVAIHQATGNQEILEAAQRFADFYYDAWKNEHPYFKTVGTHEHPEIEPALVRLYRATGQDRYLEFAAALADMSQVGPTIAQCHIGGGQRHAVRFCYLLTGLAELTLTTGDRRYGKHLESLWDELVNTRMYLTGGIGCNEVIPVEPYDLPQNYPANNDRDIAETCASVSLMMFSWRMHALTGESKYFDVIERILYNHYLGAIAQDHLGNFYYNPLRRTGDVSGIRDHGANPVRRHRLPEIHSTACCLPNSWRFFAQLPEYMFSRRGDTIYVNLYSSASAQCTLPDGTALTVEMTTEYPHDGGIRIRLLPDQPSDFEIALRIPAWCHHPSIFIPNEHPDQPTPGRYFRIKRRWFANDTITLHLNMPPETILSNPQVAANRGQLALQRGPLIYCLEKQDADGLDLDRVVARLDPRQESLYIQEIYGDPEGYVALRIPAGHAPLPADNALYYPADSLELQGVRDVTLIPFYFRANREPDPRWITWLYYR